MHRILTEFFDTTPFLLWCGICVVILILERIFSSQKTQSLAQPAHGRVINLANGIVICLSILVITPLANIFIYWLGNRLGLGLIDLRFFPHYDFASQIASAVVLMFVEDFFYYFYHRLAHTIPVLWDIHAVHHSETHMNSTTTLRRHWLETPLQEMLVTIPMALIFRLTPVEMMVVAFGRAAFVFFAHSSMPIQIGSCSWLLTSPQLHRLHHSCLREHWDSNYAQVFPIFDLLFGTYVAPKKDEFPPTGLSTQERIVTLGDMLLWPFKKWGGRMKRRVGKTAA